MSPKLARLLTRFHSSEWRARYGEEFVAFLEESPAHLNVCLDVAKAGLRESLAQWLRRRAQAFHGVVPTRPTRVTSATVALVAMGVFITIAQATPLLAMHRTGDALLTYPSDARIKYEPGAAQLATVVSRLLPRAIEDTQSTNVLNSSFAVYIFANEKALNASVDRQKRSEQREREVIYLSPQSSADPDHILANIEAHLRRLKTEAGRNR